MTKLKNKTEFKKEIAGSKDAKKIEIILIEDGSWMFNDNWTIGTMMNESKMFETHTLDMTKIEYAKAKEKYMETLKNHKIIKMQDLKNPKTLLQREDRLEYAKDLVIKLENILKNL